ncbi:MAG: NAD(P)H-dependent oxidoreductase [Rubrimonas sp.]
MGDVLVINGHPDPSPERLCAGLAAAYAQGAAQAGRSVRRLDVGALDFPLIASRHDYEHAAPPPAIAEAQAALTAAAHVALIFPIWLGGPPARLNGFLEQVLRPGFAREVSGPGRIGRPLMKGRSVRIVATMAMPALAYRWWFMGRGVGNLRRSVLGFVGFGPIRTTYVGGAFDIPPERARALIEQAQALGRAAR